MPYYPRIPPACFAGNYSPSSLLLDWGATGTGGYVDTWSGNYVRDLPFEVLLSDRRARRFQPVGPDPRIPTRHPERPDSRVSTSPSVPLRTERNAPRDNPGRPLQQVPQVRTAGAWTDPAPQLSVERRMEIRNGLRLRSMATPRSATSNPGFGGLCPRGTCFVGSVPTPNNAWMAVCTDPRTGRVVSTFGTSRTYYPQRVTTYRRQYR